MLARLPVVRLASPSATFASAAFASDLRLPTTPVPDPRAGAQSPRWLLVYLLSPHRRPMDVCGGGRPALRWPLLSLGLRPLPHLSPASLLPHIYHPSLLPCGSWLMVCHLTMLLTETQPPLATLVTLHLCKPFSTHSCNTKYAVSADQGAKLLLCITFTTKRANGARPLPNMASGAANKGKWTTN